VIDIKALEADAQKELAEEVAKVARTKIKASLKRIQDAEKILANARLEHAALMRDISGEI
jgi:hypothetical protein